MATINTHEEMAVALARGFLAAPEQGLSTEGQGIVSRALVDAVARRSTDETAAPWTCGTCRHWHDGDGHRVTSSSREYARCASDGVTQELETFREFGCADHSPVEDGRD